MDEVRIGEKKVGTYVHTIKSALRENGPKGVTVSAWGAENIGKSVLALEILASNYAPGLTVEGNLVMTELDSKKQVGKKFSSATFLARVTAPNGVVADEPRDRPPQ